MIQRKVYLDKLIAFKEKQLIKVVTGVRRCGKSTLFELYIDYLKSVGVQEDQIVQVNLEELESEELLDYRELYRYLSKKRCQEKVTYIFIDEVQNCQNFEKAVDSLFVKKNVDVYITGSNAYMLSGELATLLSGRYVTIDMLPLSFKEYFEARGESDHSSTEEFFQEYLKHGSFPYVVMMERVEKDIKTYLEGIYHSILIKDIAKREAITDITLLEKIIKMLASSIGNPISIKKISDTINSSGRKISVNTVERYIRALCDSYIFYKVDRYDIKGRQHLKTLGKYYIVDSGIRSLLIAQSAADFGHILENIVFLELKRRGYQVNIGKLAEKEVDFVADTYDGLSYYQVAATVLDENTLKREIDPLMKIQDNYPKVLLTMDRIGAGSNYEGIRQINVLDWLLE
jgi:hypothetical protein